MTSSPSSSPSYHSSSSTTTTTTSSMTIRPVTKRLPDSTELWNDTGLPMCVVVTPTANIGNHRGHHSRKHNHHHYPHYPSSSSSSSSFENLADIPRCLQCGAPHASTLTHFRSFQDRRNKDDDDDVAAAAAAASTSASDSTASVLVCYLCGGTSSTLWEDQQAIRKEERLNPLTYDHPRHRRQGRQQKQLQSQAQPNNHEDSDNNTNHTSSQSSETIVHVPLFPRIEKVPALSCPPIWWIVLDGNGPSSYWKTVSSVLSKLCEHKQDDEIHTTSTTATSTTAANINMNIPSYCHLGILVASSDSLSVWDLSSAVPHVSHLPWTSSSFPLSLTPYSSASKGLPAVCRAMEDGSSWKPPPSSSSTTSSSGSKGNNQVGMPLSLVLEVILDFVDDAVHPGQDAEALTNQILTNPQDPTLRYAGGKITCLLSHPPMEITTNTTTTTTNTTKQQATAMKKTLAGKSSKNTNTASSSTTISRKDSLKKQPKNKNIPFTTEGGVAGACCADPYQDKWDVPLINKDKNGTSAKTKELSDLTPKNLKEVLQPLDPEDMMTSWGSKCGNAALGVDLLIVLPQEEGGDETKDDGEIESQLLSDSTTSYGIPLLFSLAKCSGAPGPLLLQNESDLLEHIQARAPFGDVVFGTLIKSRITKGFELENSPIDPIGRSKLQLAPMLSSGGLSGPAVSMENNIWFMGSCDPHTSVVLDFQIVSDFDSTVTSDGLGHVALKPVIQICVGYTCVEQDPEDGLDYTIRKLKISSLSLPTESDSEPIYDAMDPEALALSLFHKLAVIAFEDGMDSVQDTAESWLQSLLVAVYQSAQVEQAKREELMERKMSSTSRIALLEKMNSKMLASDRLVDLDGGSLSVNEILLGQGHVKIAVMPLIVFSLMQCDALRPTMGSFCPVIDARCAAIVQMLSMTPSCLSKCIAPSLQLWSTKNDRILKDLVDLNQDALESALEEANNPEDAVFFLDSPQYILVYRADQGVAKSSSDMETLQVGPKLRTAIEVAASAYRTRPPIRYELEAIPFSDASSIAFDNRLVENCPTSSGKEDFEEWKNDLVQEVHSELKKSGDIIE